MPAYDNEECMFFIGGNDAKSNNASAGGADNGGGCTKAWWDNEVSPYVVGDAEYEAVAIAAMGKLMLSNGDAILEVEVTVLDWDAEENWVRVTPNAGDFEGIEEGMLLFFRELLASTFEEGSEIYKVLEVDESPYAWIKIEGEPRGTLEVGGQGNIKVGGAWDELEDMGREISSTNFTQEILINKDLVITEYAIYMQTVGYGDVERNTWLKITGFNRVPGDILVPNGDLYQSVMDAYKNGVHADKFVDISSDVDYPLFDMRDAENLIFTGIHFSGTGGTLNSLFYAPTGSINHVFKHCCFGGSTRYLFEYSTSHRIIFNDCFLGNNPSNLFYCYNGHLIFKNTICKIEDTINGFAGAAEEDLTASNLLIIGGSIPLNLAKGGLVAFFDSSIIGAEQLGCVRVAGTSSTPGFFLGIDNIMISDTAETSAVAIRDFGDDASMYVDGLCAWTLADVAMTDVLKNEDAALPTPFGTNIIEVNPNFDAYFEPQELTVRRNARDILNDAKSLGAIKTMNTAVIEAAVTAALGSDVTAIKGKTDGLNFAGNDIKATLDSELVKLAADGWDGLSIDEPSGDPDGWTVPQKLMWLIMRFMNKHTSDNFDGIKVHKADDSLATTQAVTEAAGVKTVAKAT